MQELTEWWRNPRLAYGRGLLDGYGLGHDEAIIDLLERVFAGGLLHEAARIVATPEPHHVHPTTPDQPGSWPRLAQDWPGTDHMTPDQRRTAYAALLLSWKTE